MSNLIPASVTLDFVSIYTYYWYWHNEHLHMLFTNSDPLGRQPPSLRGIKVYFVMWKGKIRVTTLKMILFIQICFSKPFCSSDTWHTRIKSEESDTYRVLLSKKFDKFIYIPIRDVTTVTKCFSYSFQFI